MASIMEMSLMCRLCLAKDKNQVNIPIFEDPGDIRQIFVKISSCLPIKISRDDQLPKNICDGCGDKLELLYEFWNTSLDSEKTLTAWLKQVKDPAVSAVAQQISKPAETLVKEETDAAEASTYLEPAQESSINEEAEIEEVEPEEPPKKRARRTAAVKAQINIAPESDDEDDNFDNNMDEPDSVDADVIAKLEGESEESDGDEKDPSFADLPGTSTQDQPGTSGLGKDGAEAPLIILDEVTDNKKLIQSFYCHKCGKLFTTFLKLHRHLFQYSRLRHRFRCAVCKYIVGPGLISLLYHIKRFHSSEKFKRVEEKLAEDQPEVIRYYCPSCGKGMRTLYDLLVHDKEHEGEALCCDVCPKQAPNFLMLLYHYKEHTVSGHIYLPCKMCPLEFYHSTPLKFHYYTVHKHILHIPYECDLCLGVIFDDEEKFLFHVQCHSRINKHIQPGRPRADVSKLTCEVCAQLFDTIAECKEHKTKVHQLKENLEETCPECEQLVTLNGMSDHLMEHELHQVYDFLVEFPNKAEHIETNQLVKPEEPVTVSVQPKAALVAVTLPQQPQPQPYLSRRARKRARKNNRLLMPEKHQAQIAQPDCKPKPTQPIQINLKQPLPSTSKQPYQPKPPIPINLEELKLTQPLPSTSRQPRPPIQFNLKQPSKKPYQPRPSILITLKPAGPTQTKSTECDMKEQFKNHATEAPSLFNVDADDMFLEWSSGAEPSDETACVDLTQHEDDGSYWVRETRSREYDADLSRGSIDYIEHCYGMSTPPPPKWDDDARGNSSSKHYRR